MKVLVLGGTGMLGHKLVQMLGPELEVWTTVRRDVRPLENLGVFDSARMVPGVDAFRLETVRDAIASTKPDVVMNAIGVLKGDPREAREISMRQINSILPQRLAELSDSLGFRLVLISTDCVYDGRRGNYSESDEPNATDLYGMSKRLGEAVGENVLTLRTSIIGRELTTVHSLVEWFIANRGGSVEGFANAIYSGFPTIVFAEMIKTLITEHPGLGGLYHVSSNPISKYDLLRLINDRMDLGIEVRRNEEFKIDRSLDSTRFREATGIIPPPWEEMIDRMAGDPTPYDSWRPSVGVP